MSVGAISRVIVRSLNLGTYSSLTDIEKALNILRHVRITNITINNHVLSLHGVKTNSGSPISRKLRQMRYCYGLNYSSSKNWIIAVRLERKMRTWICGFLLYLVFLNIITCLSSNHGERFSTQSMQEFAIHYSPYSRGIGNFRDGSGWAPLLLDTGSYVSPQIVIKYVTVRWKRFPAIIFKEEEILNKVLKRFKDVCISGWKCRDKST